jgi:hypothetical protein
MARDHKGQSRPFANLGDMRAFRFDALQVSCLSCSATRIVDVSVLPNQGLFAGISPVGWSYRSMGHVNRASDCSIPSSCIYVSG